MDSYLIDLPEFRLTQAEFLIRLLVATGIGFLIGLEREYSSKRANEKAFAGIRTFVFVVLLGFIGAMMHLVLAAWFFPVLLFVVGALIGISYWITSSRGDIGGTTEFSAILAFLLGALTLHGYILISLSTTVLVLVILSSKIRLHSAIGKIAPDELYDFIRFVVIALLIFPFLPDENYGPYGVINPREVGWVILITSGLGFIGYVLMRLFGQGRGILITGLIGGLVSSTAITWVFSRKSRESPAYSHHCATAILAASTIMIVRVAVWIIVFNRALMEGMIIPFAILFATALITTGYFYRKADDHKTESDIPPGKPLNLHGAIVFGIIYMLILVLVSYANDVGGSRGILFSSFVSGMTDIDAITISVARLGRSSLDPGIAQVAILLAALSNTVVKMGIAVWAGSRQLRKHLYLGYGLIFVSALVALGVLLVF